MYILLRGRVVAKAVAGRETDRLSDCVDAGIGASKDRKASLRGEGCLHQDGIRQMYLKTACSMRASLGTELHV